MYFWFNEAIIQYLSLNNNNKQKKRCGLYIETVRTKNHAELVVGALKFDEFQTFYFSIDYERM